MPGSDNVVIEVEPEPKKEGEEEEEAPEEEELDDDGNPIPKIKEKNVIIQKDFSKRISSERD